MLPTPTGVASDSWKLLSAVGTSIIHLTIGEEGT